MLQARYRKVSVHVGSLLPRVGHSEVLQNAKIPLINAQLRKLTKKLKINFCDINKALTKGGLPKSRDNWNNYGLHLTQRGNTRVKHYLIEYCKKLI